MVEGEGDKKRVIRSAMSVSIVSLKSTTITTYCLSDKSMTTIITIIPPRAFGAIDVIYEPRMVTLEWIASPCNDMFADAVLSAVLQVPQDFPRH